MRKIVRSSLPKRIVAYLHRKQAEVNVGKDVQKTWENARRTKTIGMVAEALGKMSGRRRRCMFCEDSRGTDIEHFWPKAHYQRKAFVWENMLLACSGCNRIKGDRFELDEQGQPLLIDPTAEDPWNFLYFDPATGNITARIDPQTGIPDPKGEHTTNPTILPLNVEPITDGRQRAYRRLCRAVRRFLDRAGGSGDDGSARSELFDEIEDNPDYGLVDWYFLKDGGNVSPFSELRDQHVDVWQAIVRRLAQ